MNDSQQAGQLADRAPSIVLVSDEWHSLSGAVRDTRHTCGHVAISRRRLSVMSPPVIAARHKWRLGVFIFGRLVNASGGVISVTFREDSISGDVRRRRHHHVQERCTLLFTQKFVTTVAHIRNAIAY